MTSANVTACQAASSLLAQGAVQPQRGWPDAVDLLALGGFAVTAFGLPLLGHLLLAGDVRRYLRSLSTALTTVARWTSVGRPGWAHRDRPPCLETFDLTLPCTEEEVLAAYRQRVKRLHPDHGGDLQKFLHLQKHFEQAVHLARQHQPRTRTIRAE